MVTAVRLGALALGVSRAGLGVFGAFEFAHRLEGEVTYLVLAAPLIAVTAALIPPIAEVTWRSGLPLKALIWWRSWFRLRPSCQVRKPVQIKRRTAAKRRQPNRAVAKARAEALFGAQRTTTPTSFPSTQPRRNAWAP